MPLAKRRLRRLEQDASKLALEKLTGAASPTA